MYKNPKEIMDEIDKLKPALQVDARKNKIGLPVEWKLGFCGINDKKTRVSLESNNPVSSSWSLVFCNIDISRDRQFDSIDKGHKIFVKGKIKEVEGPCISLADCRFDFSGKGDFSKKTEEKNISREPTTINISNSHIGDKIGWN